MKISFENAKNGELTCKFNNQFLQSSYNPTNEAKKFVQNIQFTFFPKIIIILEPCIPYFIDFLKKTFLNVKIGAIRFKPDFINFNTDFDFVINFFEHENNFKHFLFDFLGEENLFSTLFLPWEPSIKIFSEISKKVLLSIKNSMNKAKDILVTRQFFEKKWLINSSNFIKCIKNPIKLTQKINLPILIIASGMSLQKSLSIIQKSQNVFFIICLSSAISVCIKNQIIPDLFFSTDGGFYAGEHFKQMKNFKIPLAITTESFCKKNILQKNPILPLTYIDGISSKLFTNKKDFLFAQRNGTVSGTALEFAIENSTENSQIFFCGLDLSCGKGFQHTQPNELEQNNCIFDNRINTKQTRLLKSEFSNHSLKIYENWFMQFNTKNRKVFRIIENPNNNLQKIKDINYIEFEKISKKLPPQTKNNFFTKNDDFNNNFLQFSKSIHSIFNTEEWNKQIFPLDFLLLEHNPQNKEIKQRIQKQNDELLRKISK